MKRKRSAVEQAAREKYRAFVNEKIESYRTKYNLTLADFAARCGLNVKELRRVMYGDAFWFEDLFSIARGLGEEAWKLAQRCEELYKNEVIEQHKNEIERRRRSR